MTDFMTTPYFMVAITFFAYLLARWIRVKTHMQLLHPILISIIILIIFLILTNTSYESYNTGGTYIEFWLKPAVVALGVPLYRQLETIKKQMVPLLLAELAGCLAGLISVVAFAEIFGASRDVIISLAPKAVTTPIALEISRATGGIPPLTAAVVVCTGIFGSMAGFKIVSLCRIKSPLAGALSIGTAAHAVGTAAAMERSQRSGAFSSLGLTLNGLLTALLAPLILGLLGY